MATASDLAEWWEGNRQYLEDWSEDGLSEFVEKHPNYFAVAVATVAQTVVEFPLAIGGGFVDILNLGKGAADGGWGYLQDGLRLVSAVGPLARGGQGIINIETSRRNGPVVAAFPVADEDQVMLVTDKGKVIRIPVDGIRIAGRNTQGVTLFNVDDDEHVVSVARLEGAAEVDDGAGVDNGEDEAGDADLERLTTPRSTRCAGSTTRSCW